METIESFIKTQKVIPAILKLVDIAGIAIAVGCLASALPDARREPRKLWRLGIPPLLGIVVATLILAGAAVSLAHDMTWIGTTFLGTFTGWLRS